MSCHQAHFQHTLLEEVKMQSSLLVKYCTGTAVDEQIWGFIGTVIRVHGMDKILAISLFLLLCVLGQVWIVGFLVVWF